MNSLLIVSDELNEITFLKVWKWVIRWEISLIKWMVNGLVNLFCIIFSAFVGTIFWSALLSNVNSKYINSHFSKQIVQKIFLVIYYHMAGQNTMIFKTCRGASMQHVLQYIMANHCWIWKKVILQIMRLHSKAILSDSTEMGCAGYWTFGAIACLLYIFFLANAKVTKNSNRSKSIDPLNSQLLFLEICFLMF